MSDSEIVIVIPVYKPHMTDYELISFTQCLRIFKRSHPIVLATYKDLDCTEYLSIAKEEGVELAFSFFAQTYFKSIIGYNKLMVSCEFYKEFITHKYMLLYQLDCFVFKDELEKWAAKGYSYYGAPWVSYPDLASTAADPEVILVGNGGLSLRNITDHYKIVRFYNQLRLSFLFNFKHLKTWHAMFRLKYNDSFLYKNRVKNEDMFFGKNVGSSHQSFSILPKEESFLFSLDSHPRGIFNKYSKGVLPLGVHAWWRHDLAFLKPYIEAYGYKI